MKKTLLLLLAASLALFCIACGRAAGTTPGTAPTVGDEQEKEDEEDFLTLPSGPSQEKAADDRPEGKTPGDPQTKSTLYPPSIFVMEASGAWRQELAPGYYADYECAFYADKLDEADNQSASGQYTGVFWMKTTLDTADYLKAFLKQVPVEMSFDAGGEGVCDHISLFLMTQFERESMGGSYAIPDGKSGSIIPAGDALAARGSFIAEGKAAYLEAKARGGAGETVHYQSSQSESAEIGYVIHVAPDPDYSAAQRKVIIHISMAGGVSTTLDGVMRRLPGYSEDVKAYTSQGKRDEVLNRHLQ